MRRVAIAFFTIFGSIWLLLEPLSVFGKNSPLSRFGMWVYFALVLFSIFLAFVWEFFIKRWSWKSVLTSAGTVLLVASIIYIIYLNQLTRNVIAEPITILSSSGEETQLAKVSISRTDQLANLMELKRLNKNKYQVDYTHLVAFPVPPNDKWVIEERHDVPVINEDDLPFLKIYQSLIGDSLTPDIDAPVLAFRRHDGHTIELSAESTIDGIKVGLNLYERKAFRDFMKELFLKSMKIGSPESEPSSEDENRFTELIEKGLQAAESQMQSHIENTLPLSKEIYSGLYVMPIPDNEKLETSVMSDFFSSDTLLTRVLNYVVNQPSAGFTSSYDNLSIDQDNELASFNGSVKLKNVVVDGRKNVTLIVNNIGFIIVGPNRALFVQLIYLSSVDKLEVFRKLEDTLNTLRFAG